MPYEKNLTLFSKLLVLSCPSKNVLYYNIRGLQIGLPFLKCIHILRNSTTVAARQARMVRKNYPPFLTKENSEKTCLNIYFSLREIFKYVSPYGKYSNMFFLTGNI